MSHEEKIIDGVLCFRNSPNDEWLSMSKEDLTKKILNLRSNLLDRHTVVKLINKLDKDASTDGYSTVGKEYLTKWINENLPKI